MGSNCALVNCPAKRTINRGLSFFKVPKKGVNDEWRSQLLQKIGRKGSTQTLPTFVPDTFCNLASTQLPRAT
ncbi:hypothetical protein V1264_019062 [Littorina saxatilis]|uniref:Uncharacterized protein n=1 Tax=Littorina saxatilis TaxID=31220 RepID=A0AAN9BFR7_9CAEN